MADRDLLNKLIQAAAIERPMSDRGTPAAPPMGKLGVRERAREVGKEAAATPLGLPDKHAQKTKQEGRAGASQAATQAPGVEKPATAPAFKAAYFNQDVATTQQVNLAARPLKALRGEEGATDLRRVVLPSPSAAEASGEPAVLVGALERMQLPEEGQSPLANLVERQTEWSQRPSVKAETIAARQEALERMVEARKAALERMRLLSESAQGLSGTVSHALAARGDALTREGADIEKDGNALIEDAEKKTTGMRQRVAKVVRSAR